MFVCFHHLLLSTPLSLSVGVVISSPFCFISVPMVPIPFVGITSYYCLAFCQSPFRMTMSNNNNNNNNNDLQPMRTLSETLHAKRWVGGGSGSDATTDIYQRAAIMKERTAATVPYTDAELDDVIRSVRNLVPAAVAGGSDEIDYTALRDLLHETAHLSHRDWSTTERNGRRLSRILFPAGGIDDTTASRSLLFRILREGNWDGAVTHAVKVHGDDGDRHHHHRPWAVLVTGVNGIRKTTSLYQEWFPRLLQEALVIPPQPHTTTATKETSENDTSLHLLPSGKNSFFRQLDHMIATLCNEDFCILYQLTDELMQQHEVSTEEALVAYSDLKAAIFGRYRTLSELLGAAILQQAKGHHANCLMETSGRDVAMFHYVNHFFGSNDDDGKNNKYRKLALHFTINDLRYACDSVDRRMEGELRAGLRALHQADASAIVCANAGGPYGSAVLADVQEASDRVWDADIVPTTSPVASDWYKATIRINAHDTEPWTAQAVRPDGSLGTVFTFAPKE